MRVALGDHLGSERRIERRDLEDGVGLDEVRDRRPRDGGPDDGDQVHDPLAGVGEQRRVVGEALAEREEVGERAAKRNRVAHRQGAEVVDQHVDGRQTRVERNGARGRDGDGRAHLTGKRIVEAPPDGFGRRTGGGG